MGVRATVDAVATEKEASTPELVESGRSASVAGRIRAALQQIGFRFPVRYRVVWVALAMLMLFVGVTEPQTFGTTSMKLTTAYTGVLFTATIGQILVVMVGGIDITVASIMTLSGAIVVRESQGSNSKLFSAILIALAVALGIGAVKAVLIVLLRLNALIVTLAMSGIITGGMLLWTGVSYSVNGNVPSSLHHFSTQSFGILNYLGALSLGIGVVTALILRSTKVGRSYVAAGTNPVAARIIGIPVTAYQMAAYMMASVLFAVAGIFLAGYLGSPDETLGSPYLLLTFVTIALAGVSLSGGPASILCAAASSFFLSLLDEYLDVRGVSGGAAELLQGIVLVLAVGAIAIATNTRALLAWCARFWRSRRRLRARP